MKSKNLQNIGLSMYQKGDTPITEIHRDLNSGISLATIKRWYQMIRQCGSTQLLGTHAGPRIVTNKENIQKVKNRLRRKQKVSARKLRRELSKCQMNIKNRFRVQIL